MFFEMRFDLGTLDSGERSLPFGQVVKIYNDPRLTFDLFMQRSAWFLLYNVSWKMLQWWITQKLLKSMIYIKVGIYS